MEEPVMLTFPAWCLAIFVGFITGCVVFGFILLWWLGHHFGRPPDTLETTRHRWSINPPF
jgi:hypothetical protein